METTPDHAAPTATCRADPVLRMLWGQWKTHVIHVLGTGGPCRFGVLRRTIAGISPKVLTQRLRELEDDALVWREQTETIPPQVTYGLTERGARIHAVLCGFDDLAAEFAAQETASTESPPAARAPLRSDGSALGGRHREAARPWEVSDGSPGAER